MARPNMVDGGDKLQIWTTAVNVKINLWVPLKTEKLSIIQATVSCYIWILRHGVSYEERRRRQVPLRAAKKEVVEQL
jgi:hypothetical protein